VTVKDMRARFAWGIDRLWIALRRAGHRISMASVGRVEKELPASGEIVPIRFRKDPEARKGTRKRNRKLRYGKRGIPAKGSRMGQPVKMDTMHVGLPCGEKIYYISAVDVYFGASGLASTRPPARPTRPTCSTRSATMSTSSRYRSTAAPSSAEPSRPPASRSACPELAQAQRTHRVRQRYWR